MKPKDNEYLFLEQARLEASYLKGRTPQQQSGFAYGELEWKRFRHPIVEAIHKGGSFLDVGCANGLLMECVPSWAGVRGHKIEVFGLDISDKLVDLARRRLPDRSDQIFVGDAWSWEPPRRFDFVRTELVYVPESRRRDYVERLLSCVVAPGGRLLICSYGSSRLEGKRAEILTDKIEGWGLSVAQVNDALDGERRVVVTRVVSVDT